MTGGAAPARRIGQYDLVPTGPNRGAACGRRALVVPASSRSELPAGRTCRNCGLSPVSPTLQEAPLHFKKIDRFWAVRVGLHYRALAVRDEADVVWFWIGPHAEYDRLIRQV